MTTLMIKDLVQTEELSGKAMSAVRGGIGNQANGTNQSNLLGLMAPLSVANGAQFLGSGPVIIQADSNVDQTASNDSFADNYKSAYGWFYA